MSTTLQAYQKIRRAAKNVCDGTGTKTALKKAQAEYVKKATATAKKAAAKAGVAACKTKAKAKKTTATTKKKTTSTRRKRAAR